MERAARGLPLEGIGGRDMYLGKRIVVALALFLLIGGVAWADSIPIDNATFGTAISSPPLSSNCGTGCSYNVGPIPGWTGGGSFAPNSTYYTVSDLPGGPGSIVGYTNGGSIFQSLTSYTPLADTLYTFSIEIGNRLDGFSAGAFTISLDSGATQLCSFSGFGSNITPGQFGSVSCSGTTGATPGTLELIISSGGGQVDVADASLTSGVTAVPEPSTLFLLLVGMLAAVGGLQLVRR